VIGKCQTIYTVLKC